MLIQSSDNSNDHPYSSLHLSSQAAARPVTMRGKKVETQVMPAEFVNNDQELQYVIQCPVGTCTG